MATVSWEIGASDATVINDGATLATGVRAAGDYNNSTNLALLCNVFLKNFHFDTTAPSANTIVADLYILPGQTGTTGFPEGGDAGLGTDDTPQAIFYVGSFETINPSTSVEETLALGNIPLFPEGNRFVLLNTSGQTFTNTWNLGIIPYRFTVA